MPEPESEEQDQETIEAFPAVISDEEKDAWEDIDGVRVLPLTKPFTSGHGLIEKLYLSEPSGFNYEKIGQPFKMLSGGKKNTLEGEDAPIEIEINVKKLNRYIELSNNPQLGMLEARQMCMTDIKNAHNAMLDFFGK